jgi:hypothetical protein
VLLPLIQQRVLPLLLLVEDVNGILQFCQPRLLPIDVLSLSVDALGSYLSSHDGLLLLPKPLYLLLDPNQLVLLSLGIIFFCFVPILEFDLIELSFTLVDLGGRGGGGGLVLRCWSPPPVWLVPAVVVDMLAYCS